MTGRRWSDGLHQAVGAKEGVAIRRRTRRSPHHVLNYFRLYAKLAGMTGTADTEALGSGDLRPGNRGHPAQPRAAAMTSSTASTRRGKYDAAIADIRELPRARPAGARGHDLDQNSELISGLLTQAKLRTRCSTPSGMRARSTSSPRPAGPA